MEDILTESQSSELLCSLWLHRESRFIEKKNSLERVPCISFLWSSRRSWKTVLPSQYSMGPSPCSFNYHSRKSAWLTLQCKFPPDLTHHYNSFLMIVIDGGKHWWLSHFLVCKNFVFFTKLLISFVAMIIYDYIVTLQDEVNAVWKREKSFTSFALLLNRYSLLLLAISFISLLLPVYGNPVTEKVRHSLMYRCGWKT